MSLKCPECSKGKLKTVASHKGFLLGCSDCGAVFQQKREVI
jgi:uncharacterized Zn finger protein